MEKLRIVKLEAHNIKRLRAFAVNPTDHRVTKISGKNGAGKTSALDCITYAFAGGRAIDAEPLRKGARKGQIVVDCEAFEIRRTFTQAGTRLEVTAKDGVPISSPQGLLDTVYETLAFDPSHFDRLPPAEQVATVRRLAGVDTTAVEADIEQLFEDRKNAKRDADRAKVAADASRIPAGPILSEPVIVGDLLAELGRRREHNEVQRGRAQRIESAKIAVKQQSDLVLRLRAELADAEQMLGDTRLQEQKNPKPEPSFDEEDITRQLATAEQANEAFRAVERARELRKAASEARTTADELDESLQGAREHRADLIESAKLPVEGLSFGQTGVTYRGVPLAQASQAERLTVGIAMAMALEPKLRILRLTDASLLDSESWNVVERMAEEHDFWVLAEVVDETGQIGVYLEDGEIVAVDGVPA